MIWAQLGPNLAQKTRPTLPLRPGIGNLNQTNLSNSSPKMSDQKIMGVGVKFTWND